MKKDGRWNWKVVFELKSSKYWWCCNFLSSAILLIFAFTKFPMFKVHFQLKGLKQVYELEPTFPYLDFSTRMREIRYCNDFSRSLLHVYTSRKFLF